MKAPAKIGKAVKRAMLSSLAMTSGNEKRIHSVILDGTVRDWVGFGWIDRGKPTAAQKKVLPVVVD